MHKRTKKYVSLIVSLLMIFSMVSLAGAVTIVSANTDWAEMAWEDDTIAVIWRGTVSEDRYDVDNWEQFDNLFPIDRSTRATWDTAVRNEGAIRSAEDGDVIIMVASMIGPNSPDAFWYAAPMDNTWPLVVIDRDRHVTLDMAGHGLDIERANAYGTALNTGSGGAFATMFFVAADAELTVRNTVDGAGAADVVPNNMITIPETVPAGRWRSKPFHPSGNLRASGRIFAGAGTINIDNIRFGSIRNTEANAPVISMIGGVAGGTFNINNALLIGHRDPIQMGGGRIYLNVTDTEIRAERLPIAGASANPLIGSFTDSLIVATGGGAGFHNTQITTNNEPGFTFDYVTFAINGNGNTPLDIRGGTVRLINNTSVQGSGAGRPHVAVRVNGTQANPATLITENVTLGGISDWGGGNPGTARALDLFGEFAHARLGANTRIRGSNAGVGLRPVWVNLYNNVGNRDVIHGEATPQGGWHDGTDESALAPGMAVFRTGDTATPVLDATTVVPRNHNPFTTFAPPNHQAVIAPCQHWGYADDPLALDCGICLTSLRTCDCDDAGTVWTETTAPTCVAEGEETRQSECQVHGYETRPVAINPDNHTPGEWLEESSSGGVVQEVQRCMDCDAVLDSRTAYEVTLDGVVTAVAAGANFTFPASTAAGFIAYTDGDGNFFNTGYYVAVNEPMSFTTVALDVSMAQGAAMRLGTPSGLRFLTNVNTEAVAVLRAGGADVTMGTLIAPADLLGGSALTLATPAANRLDVAFNSPGWHIDSEIDFIGIAGTIANVRDANASRNFVGRGYVSVSLTTVNGNTIAETVYASYAGGDIANNTRSIGWIASRIIESNQYNGLSEANRTTVRHYYDLWNEQTAG